MNSTALRLPAFVVAAALCLGGCMMPMPQAAPASAVRPPVQVDLAKWASWMYPDLYVDKNVVAEGYYLVANMGAGDFHQGAPQVGFALSSVSFGYDQGYPKTFAEMDAYSKKMQNYAVISAYAPISMRDQLIGLKNGTRVRVSGVARQTGVYNTLFGKQYTGIVGLALFATSIEPY